MMQYNVAQLLKETPGAVRDHTIDEEVTFDRGAAERVQGNVSLQRTNEGVWAHAVVDVHGTCSCSRCLRAFPHVYHLTIDEEYLPTVDVNTGLPVELPEQDADESFTIDGQHILDLYEAVRQYRIAAEPMKALCQPDCQGLCPTCGVNLTQGPCNCRREAIDPRWSTLRAIIAKDS